MTVTYWEQKGEPLTPAEYDENVRSLVERLDAYDQMGLQAEGIAVVSQVNGDTAFILTTTENRTFGPWSLPNMKRHFKYEWQPGISYTRDDIFTSGGELYYVGVTHVAAASLATDIGNLRVTKVAVKGKDNLSDKGIFDPTATYEPFDTVYVVEIIQGQNFYQRYVAHGFVLPGGGPPGFGDRPWLLFASSLAYSDFVFDRTRAQWLDVLIGEIYAKLAALDGAATNHNSRLAALDGQAYPYP